MYILKSQLCHARNKFRCIRGWAVGRWDARGRGGVGRRVFADIGGSLVVIFGIYKGATDGDGTFKTNVSKGAGNYTATRLDPNTNYTIGTHTVDDKEDVNQTWKNDTAKTLPFTGLQRINVTPTAGALHISESINFNATGHDHN